MTARSRFAAGVVGAMLVGGVVSGCAATPTRTTAIPYDAASSSSSGATSVAAPRTATRIAEGAGVVSVVDGDTFRLSDGHEVRVLGIDSCEMSTPGGRRAKQDAQDLLTGASITIETEPGVDTDRYGRLLRYVDLGAKGDFATAMVRESHTAVYAGHNDASEERVDELRAADTDGRDCSVGPAPVTRSTTTVTVPDGDDDHHRHRHVDVVPDVPAVPEAPTRQHTGHTGHPCLPGERDGDHDGYCGEGR